MNEDERKNAPSTGSVGADGNPAAPVANHQQHPAAAAQLDPAPGQALAAQHAQAEPEPTPASGQSLATPEPSAAQAPQPNPSDTIDMMIQFTLDGTVTEAARARIEDCIKDQVAGFTSKLRDVERSERESGAEQAEFTASTVIKAHDTIRRQSGDSQPGILTSTFAVVAPLSSAAAAISGAYLHSVWQAILFGITATVAVIATVLSVVLPRLRSK